MPPPKTILLSATIGIVVYVLLMVPWAGWDREYAALFRTGGNAVFSSRFWIWPEANVHFLDLHSPTLVDDLQAALPPELHLPPRFKPPGPVGVKDTLLVLQNQEMPMSPGLLRTSSRMIGYSPTALFIALAMATPVALTRRVWVLLWGLLLVHVFIAFRLTLYVTSVGFAIASKKYHLFEPSEFWFGTLERATDVFMDNPTFCYVVAIVIWALVLVALGTWSRWRLRCKARRA